MDRGDFFRRQLRLRNEWIRSAKSSSRMELSEADLVAVECVLHVSSTATLVVPSDGLRAKLVDVYRNIKTPQTNRIVVATRQDEGDREVHLCALADLRETNRQQQASERDCATLVYGWSNGWSPGMLEGWHEPTRSLLMPMTGVGPSLWRCSLQLLTSVRTLHETHALLGRISALINDADLDIFALLERNQLLEQRVREKRRGPKPDAKVDPDRKAVERELAEAQRTIILQQQMLAAAYDALR